MEEYDVDLFEKYQRDFNQIINDSNFLLQVRLGDELIVKHCQDSQFLDFICQNAFSTKFTTNTKICIESINVFQSPIAFALLEDQKKFLTYFVLYDNSPKCTQITLINTLSHFLLSFQSESIDFILDNEIITKILLSNVSSSYPIQEFFLSITNINSEKLNNFLVGFLEEYLDNNKNSSEIFDKSAFFIILEAVNIETADHQRLLIILEKVFEENPKKSLLIALKLEKSDTIYHNCLEFCENDSIFDETKVLALEYLTKFPNDESYIVISNISKHFFAETNNSIFHLSVLSFLEQAISFEKSKEMIISCFKNQLIDICVSDDLHQNCPLIGACFMASKILLDFIQDNEWRYIMEKRLFYWEKKTKAEKCSASTFSFDFDISEINHDNDQKENKQITEIQEEEQIDEKNEGQNLLNDKKLFDFTSGIDINSFSLNLDEEFKIDLPELPF